jgi:PPOX class probable F420-dependent enzyme
MAGRRSQITMTPDEVEAFLDLERTMQVASINRDGTPHLVAMWYTRHRGDLAFWTYAKSQKVVNVRRDPRITVMVERGARYEELQGVTIYGRARIVDDLDEVFAFGDVLYERYWGPVDRDATRERVRAMGRKRVLITVERERTISWDHAKLGGTY